MNRLRAIDSPSLIAGDGAGYSVGIVLGGSLNLTCAIIPISSSCTIDCVTIWLGEFPIEMS